MTDAELQWEKQRTALIDTLGMADTPKDERHEFEQEDGSYYATPEYCTHCGAVKEHEIHNG